MKPERIAELQNYNGLRLSDFRDGELADLLDTAEREAVLREAAGRVVRTAVCYRSGPGSRYCDVASDVMENLREALESKDGET